MVLDHGEFERSIAYADSAMTQIKALRIPATPQNFEFWYTYASAQNLKLNAAINDLLERGETITSAQIDELYLKHFSAARIGERIDEVGTQIAGEIEQVMSMIGVAIGSANTYSESLAGASKDIASETDRENVRAIVETLVRATREVEHANHSLQQRLTDSRQEIRELQDNLAVVRTEALTDPLTTLANRKYFEDSMRRLLKEAEASRHPLSVILTDIDHFKKFNDTYGHMTGDQVLRLVAMALKHNVKGQDVASRYGGEEFAVILPNTALAQAVTVADHIRRAVQAKELMRRSTGETLGRVTISLGVAMLRPGESSTSLIERADACLYAAKGAGRNCVIAETALDKPDTPAKVA